MSYTAPNADNVVIDWSIGTPNPSYDADNIVVDWSATSSNRVVKSLVLTYQSSPQAIAYLSTSYSSLESILSELVTMYPTTADPDVVVYFSTKYTSYSLLTDYSSYRDVPLAKAVDLFITQIDINSLI